MHEGSTEAAQQGAAATAPPSRETRSSSTGARVQLRHAVRGKSFDEQESMLTPRGVQDRAAAGVAGSGSALPHLGAHREYVAEDWQRHVLARLAEAAIILVVLDETPGLLWEIEQIFALRLHERTILVQPAAEHRVAVRRWRAARAAIRRARPELHARMRLRLARALAIVFDADASPCRILGRNAAAEYYRDAVALAAWWTTRQPR